MTKEAIKYNEGVYNDIERAFGNLKSLWKYVSGLIDIWSLNGVANLIKIAIEFDNFMVADNIMDDVHQRYSPAKIKDFFGYLIPIITPHFQERENANIVDTGNNVEDDKDKIVP